MAEVDFNQMDGLEVLVYLLANEPTLWGIIGLGVIAFIGSIIFDKWNNKEVAPHKDDYPHMH